MTADVTASPYLPVPDVRLTHPVWSRYAAIYQLNQRQFTPESTFAPPRHTCRGWPPSVWTSCG